MSFMFGRRSVALSVRVAAAIFLTAITVMAKAAMVAYTTVQLNPVTVLDFQFSDLVKPFAMKERGECEKAGRLMVLVVAYPSDSPFSGSPYASGCWHVNGSSVVVDAKVLINGEPLHVSFPTSRVKPNSAFTSWGNYGINPARKNAQEKAVEPIPEKKPADVQVLPNTIAYAIYGGIPQALNVVQLQDTETSSPRCAVKGARSAFATVGTSDGGTTITSGSEACWYMELEGEVVVYGLSPDAANEFPKVFKKDQLTTTQNFVAWPEPCRTNEPSRRFRCRFER